MNWLVSLAFASGAAAIWWSLCTPAPVRNERLTRVQRLIAESGSSQMTAQRFWVATFGAAALAGLLIVGLSGSTVLALSAALAAGCLPWQWLTATARKRRLRLRSLWPEVVDHLASGVRSGCSLAEAVADLASRGPAALRPHFSEFAADYGATGSFEHSLSRLQYRLADPTADHLLTALRIAREVGGHDLGRLLRCLSGFLRSEAAVRGELLARQSWTVGGARLASAAPWVVLGLLATRGGTVEAFDSPAGVAIILAGAGCTALAYRLMRRIGRLPEVERPPVRPEQGRSA